MSGCAWIAVPSVTATPSSPRAEIEEDLAHCEQHSASVKADIVGAILVGIIGINVFADSYPHKAAFDNGTTKDDPSERSWGVGIGAIAGAYILSAIVGHGRVNDCDDLHEQVANGTFIAPPAPAAPDPEIGPARAGTEGQVCRVDRSCDVGLACDVNTCVRR